MLPANNDVDQSFNGSKTTGRNLWLLVYCNFIVKVKKL